jgi:hypothetical protein
MDSSHQYAAITWFPDRYDACLFALSDSSRRIGAAIVSHYNFTGDVMFSESSPRLLNAPAKVSSSLRQGMTTDFNRLSLAFELH